MITPPELHDSSRDPFRRLMALNDEVERDGALASCLLPVQPWIDVPGLSWKAVVDRRRRSPGSPRRAAERLMAEAWAARHEFLAGRRPPIDDALAEALAGPPPVVHRRCGRRDERRRDRRLDGAPARRAAAGRRERAPVDPRRSRGAAGDRARGEGETVDLELGAGEPGAYNERTPWRPSSSGSSTARSSTPIRSTPATARRRGRPRSSRARRAGRGRAHAERRCDRSRRSTSPSAPTRPSPPRSRRSPT